MNDDERVWLFIVLRRLMLLCMINSVFLVSLLVIEVLG